MGVADDAESGVAAHDPLGAAAGFFRPINDGHLPSVHGVADADAATVVEADPRRAGRQHHVGRDPQRRLHRDRVGGIPAGRGERPVQLLLGAHEGDVDRIAAVAAMRRGVPRGAGERGMAGDGRRGIALGGLGTDPDRRHDDGSGNEAEAVRGTGHESLQRRGAGR